MGGRAARSARQSPGWRCPLPASRGGSSVRTGRRGSRWVDRPRPMRLVWRLPRARGPAAVPCEKFRRATSMPAATSSVHASLGGGTDGADELGAAHAAKSTSRGKPRYTCYCNYPSDTPRRRPLGSSHPCNPQRADAHLPGRGDAGHRRHVAVRRQRPDEPDLVRPARRRDLAQPRDQPRVGQAPRPRQAGHAPLHRPDDQWRWAQVQGEVIDRTTEGGERHIDELSQRYLGRLYADHRPEDPRQIVRVRPIRITGTIDQAGA